MTMKRSLLFSCLLLLLAVPAVHAQTTLGAVLSVAQEVPAPVGPNLNGFGNATVTIDAAHTSATVALTVAGLSSPVNNAHIHKNPIGVQGNVVINFLPATNMSGGRLNATFAIDKALGDDMVANPTNYYVNVHTTQNPGGEIRGQLTAQSDAVLLSAELRGSNEVPPTGSTIVGSSLITIDSSNVVTFEVNADGIVSPTLSHIHKAAAGANGSVVVTFASSAAGFIGGRTKGTIQIDPTLAADIKANPSGYYVNVHTTAFGGGEIRGQLAPANEYDTGVSGKVSGASGTNFVTDVRIFNPSFTSKAVALVEFMPQSLTGNVNASASKPIEIAARGEAVLDDVNGANHLNVPGVLGALRITSQNPLAVTSNIYNDQRSNGKGTFGQFVPGLSRASLLRRGILPHLSNSSATDSGFRTNIGVFNPNQSAVIIRAELRTADGTLLGTQNLTVPGLAQQQFALSTLVGGVDLTSAGEMTISFDASAPVLGYAARNDNVSGDSIFIFGQPDPGVSASQP